MQCRRQHAVGRRCMAAASGVVQGVCHCRTLVCAALRASMVGGSEANGQTAAGGPHGRRAVTGGSGGHLSRRTQPCRSRCSRTAPVCTHSSSSVHPTPWQSTGQPRPAVRGRPAGRGERARRAVTPAGTAARQLSVRPAAQPDAGRSQFAAHLAACDCAARHSILPAHPSTRPHFPPHQP